MGIGAYSKGWSDPNEYDEYNDSDNSYDNSSSISLNERLYRFRFSVPSPLGTDRQPNLVKPGTPATKRVLFLDGLPFKIYEHGLWKYKNAYNVLNAFTAICPEKNNLTNKPCSLCSVKNYPYFVGFFPVIDMGQVEYNNGKVILHHEYWDDDKGERHERSFQRVLLGAKRGSLDKPGVLKVLQMEMERLKSQFNIDDLTGTVWDTTRTGKKDASVGSSWRFIEKIDPRDFERYLISYGAEPENLKLDIPVYYDPDSGNGVFDISVDEYCDKLSILVGNILVGNGNVSEDNRNRVNKSNTNNNYRRENSTAHGAGFGGGYVGRPDVPPPDDDDIPF